MPDAASWALGQPNGCRQALTARGADLRGCPLPAFLFCQPVGVW
jgi:hypothetical protein